MKNILNDEIATPHARQFDLSAFKPKLAPKETRGRREKYPWRTMDVLETFIVHADDALISSVRCMASTKGRDLGKRFSVTSGPGGGSYVTRES